MIRVREEFCRKTFKKFWRYKDTVQPTRLGGLVTKPSEVLSLWVQISDQSIKPKSETEFLSSVEPSREELVPE